MNKPCLQKSCLHWAQCSWTPRDAPWLLVHQARICSICALCAACSRTQALNTPLLLPGIVRLASGRTGRNTADTAKSTAAYETRRCQIMSDAHKKHLDAWQAHQRRIRSLSDYQDVSSEQVATKHAGCISATPCLQWFMLETSAVKFDNDHQNCCIPESMNVA